MACPQPPQEAFPIDPLALAFDYPGGRVDLMARRLDGAPRELTPARAALARLLVARRCGCDAAGIEIGHNPDGAPRIVAPARALSLSLAGRDDLVAAAVADGPLGVDIETIGAPVEPAFNVLHPAERAALAAAGAEAHAHFLWLWTLKEAYVKAIETGLSREPAEIEIRRLDNLSPENFSLDAPASFRIFDCDRPVTTALARAGRAIIGGRAAMVACVVLARA